MRNRKKDIVQFFTWLRNGIAFSVTWLLILELIYNQFANIQTISTDHLCKLFVLAAGGVFIFCTFFTRILFKKWSFVRRLTCFLFLFSLYECLVFYWSGYFINRATVGQRLIFIGILMILYLICIGIYQQYSKKRGEIYTQALKKYQQQRSNINGK